MWKIGQGGAESYVSCGKSLSKGRTLRWASTRLFLQQPQFAVPFAYLHYSFMPNLATHRKIRVPLNIFQLVVLPNLCHSQVQKGGERVAGEVLQGAHSARFYRREARVPQLRTSFRQRHNGTRETGLQNDRWQGLPEEVTKQCL